MGIERELNDGKRDTVAACGGMEEEYGRYKMIHG